jgi:hypothetical protein
MMCNVFWLAVLWTASCGWDKAIQYAPDPECNQLYDQFCSSSDAGIVCCHTDRSESCNVWSGRCEVSIDVPTCSDPTCMRAKRAGDGGVRD